MDRWRDIRARARAARELLGPRFADAPAQALLDALLGRWDVALDLAAPDHPLLRGARAAWREEYDLILVDRTLPAPERAFAIAHELGHCACHAGGYACDAADIDEAALPVVLPFGEGRVWGYNPRQAREVEANVFAGELLAPAAGLRARFLAGDGYRALAEAYGVTPTCILNGLVGAVLGGVGDEPAGDAHPGDVTLDPSQRRAAEAVAPRVLVDAGPGTGKTRTLVARVLHLLRTAGITGPEILVLTFSHRAAEELRERLRRAAPEAAGVIVSTFHGFALDALRRFAPQAGLPDDFRVVDDVDAALLLEGALPDLGLEQYAHLARPALYLPSLLDARSRMHDELLTVDAIAPSVHAACAVEGDATRRAQLDETLRLLVAYDGVLAAHGVVDYGGLITRTIALLQSDAPIAAALRGGLRHVLVDEYQDVNRASAVLLQELVRDGAALWVVGDLRQAIYSFRGAEPRNVSDFERDFPRALRFTLDVNYRAVPALVDTASSVAQALTGMEAAWTAHRRAGEDDAVICAVAPDESSEGAGIAADIARSIAAGRRPDDHAVLCRTHRQAAVVAAALNGAGLPTSYLGAFFLRPEIKDLLALLELCRGPDGSALLRLARWPEYRLDEGRAAHVIGAAREGGVPFPMALRSADLTSELTADERAALARVADHVEAVRYYPDPASVLLHYLFGDAPYLRRLLGQEPVAAGQAASALFQLVLLARGYITRPRIEPDGGTTRAFLSYVRRLLADGDAGAAQATAAVPGAVNVLTVHASKGLEFPVVYVPNLAQGRFPPRTHGGPRVALPASLELDRARAADEERNLFFVAASRAADRLVLSRALRYGGRAARESELLSLVAAARSFEEVSWPAVVASAAASSGAVAPAGVAISARDVEEVARCPAQYRYRRRLSLYGDAPGHGYGVFARLLRAGVTQLREAYGTAAWPASWDEAAARLGAWWDESWPPDQAFGPWYRAVAWRTFERTFRAMDTHGASPGMRYGEEYVVDLEGTTVRVRIDAVEEVDGVPRLIRERPARRSGDATSLAVALYGAAARQTVPEGQVLIRYLDSGETRAVPDAGRVIDKHRARIRAVLSRLAQDALPPLPQDDEECLRCPLVFVCPR